MRFLLPLLLSVFTLSACVTTPPMSPQQRRALQKRTYDYDMKSVFNAFKTILQDEGYIIRNQDFAGGMLLAEMQKSTGSGMAFLSVLGGNSNSDYATSEGYSVSVSFEEINKKTTETRITLEKTTRMKRGGQQGDEILDPAIYKDIYQKVDVELKRRAAQGK